MKKRISVLMMLFVMLLSACGGRQTEPEELLQQVRGQYMEMTACSGHGEITADYGQRVYSFGIDFSWEKEGETKLILTSPENVSGTIAHISAGETALEFDGVMLETGALDSAGLTPIDAIPAMLAYAREGFVSSCILEEDTERQILHILCADPAKQQGQGVEADLWFDGETFSLLRGEISSDGMTVLQCEISDFTASFPQKAQKSET